ncbi:glycosyltransferase family 4 protein [Acidimicrobiia bacterium]|nr:glycosyltransferase family 4 protein [Acidimicrobiia bacterium]
MKKILVVHNRYKLQGGEDIAVDNEISVLESFFEVETLIFENKGINIFSDLVNFVFNKNFKSVKKLNQKIDLFKPDFVYVHNTWFKASVAIFDVLKKRNIKTVIKLHNFRYDCTRHFFFKGHLRQQDMCSRCGAFKEDSKLFNKYYEESFLKSLLVIRYGKKFFQKIHNKNVQILVLTKFHKNYLENLGFEANNIEILPNPNQNSTIRNDKKSNSLVYAGRISREKGIKELIDSFIKAKTQNINLLLIGSGPQLNYLKREYRDINNIKFLGQLDNEEVKNIISDARAVITATKLLEGQPTLLCEASSMRIPSIFPRFGGIHEFFPSDSKLSFKQYDYQDLVQKIKQIDMDDFIDEGIRNEKFYLKHFDEINFSKKMSEIFND